MGEVSNLDKLSSSDSSNRSLQKAIECHRNGEFTQAAMIYQEVLDRDENNPDALHLLGMLLDVLGNTNKAMELIHLALRNKPNSALYHNNLGSLYFKSGQVENARQCFANALKFDSDYLEAKYNIANAYLELNDDGLAEIFYLKALAQNSDFSPAAFNLAELYFYQGNFPAAIRILEKLPDNEEKRTRLSAVHMQYGESLNGQEKTHQLVLAVEIDENNILAKKILAQNNFEDGLYEQSLDLYESIIESNQNDEEALFNCGVVFKKLGNVQGAIECYQKILTQSSNSIDANYNLANIYKEKGSVKKALKLYDQVLVLDVFHYGALINSGVVLSWLGEFDAALDRLHKAEQINEYDYILQNNIGMLYQAKRDTKLAIEHYDKAINIDNDRPEAYWNSALNYLLAGNYKTGWERYEYRWDVSDELQNAKRSYEKPIWRGESLKDKTLFIYCEQGYGDSIQFFRFLPKIVESGAKVILECPKSLWKLFQCSGIELVEQNQVNLNFDYFCPMMSIPQAINLVVSDIPSETSYLAVKNKDVDNWKNIILKNDNRNIGLCWAGNPRKNDVQTNKIDSRRSCRLDLFNPLCEIAGLNFYSLQKGESEYQLMNNVHRISINNAVSLVDDFYDTACLIANLDLVITVDTAIAHLASALGKPVWMLSRFDGCWRWLLDSEASPWYPNMKIYRQSSPGDWDSVIEKIKQDLVDFS